MQAKESFIQNSIYRLKNLADSYKYGFYQEKRTRKLTTPATEEWLDNRRISGFIWSQIRNRILPHKGRSTKTATSLWTNLIRPKSSRYWLKDKCTLFVLKALLYWHLSGKRNKLNNTMEWNYSVISHWNQPLRAMF